MCLNVNRPLFIYGLGYYSILLFQENIVLHGNTRHSWIHYTVCWIV